MCGRFACSVSTAEILETFDVDVCKNELPPSYNIAPTQEIRAVVQNERGTRGLVALKWGLIPSWAQDPSIASKMINARSETAHEKPSFREALRHRRCLIVANGFYEWAKTETENKTPQRRPCYIHCQNQDLFAFAGLYEFWQNPTGERIATCTILTTEANQAIAGIHPRMPVILTPETYALWLDKSVTDPRQLQPLFQAWPAAETAYYPVSEAVNQVRCNGPECLKPLKENPVL